MDRKGEERPGRSAGMGVRERLPSGRQAGDAAFEALAAGVAGTALLGLTDGPSWIDAAMLALAVLLFLGRRVLRDRPA